MYGPPDQSRAGQFGYSLTPAQEPVEPEDELEELEELELLELEELELLDVLFELLLELEELELLEEEELLEVVLPPPKVTSTQLKKRS